MFVCVCVCASACACACACACVCLVCYNIYKWQNAKMKTHGCFFCPPLVAVGVLSLCMWLCCLCTASEASSAFQHLCKWPFQMDDAPSGESYCPFHRCSPPTQSSPFSSSLLPLFTSHHSGSSLSNDHSNGLAAGCKIKIALEKSTTPFGSIFRAICLISDRTFSAHAQWAANILDIICEF